MNTLFVDTATCGQWLYREPSTDPRQPHMVRLATLLECNAEPDAFVRLIRPEQDWRFEQAAFQMNGIDRERCAVDGIPLSQAVALLASLFKEAQQIVAFNADFHRRVIERSAAEIGIEIDMAGKEWLCAMRGSTKIVKKPAANNRGYAWPKQTEAYAFFSGKQLPEVSVDPLARGLALVDATRTIHFGIIEHTDHQPAA